MAGLSIFSHKKSGLSAHSRDLHRTDVADEEEMRTAMDHLLDEGHDINCVVRDFVGNDNEQQSPAKRGRSSSR